MTQGNLVVKRPILFESAREEVILITVGEVPDRLMDIFRGSDKVWVGARDKSRRLDFVWFNPGLTFWWTESTPWGLTPVPLERQR